MTGNGSTGHGCTVDAERSWAGSRWRRPLAACLAALAAGPLLLAVWVPVFGALPAAGARALATIASVATLLAAAEVLRQSALAVGLLWAALGSATALTTVGIFSIGMLFAPAVPLLLASICLVPDPAGGEDRLGWHTAAAFAGGYAAVFLPLHV